VSLTGGYDTRLIMAHLDRKHTTGVSYTFGGAYRDCFDVKIARQVADVCHYQHHVLPIDRRFFESFPLLAERTVYISDGHLGATNAYELYLNMGARGIAPVKLTGSFGSEVMRGSRAFSAKSSTPGFITPEFTRHIDESVRSFEETTRGNRLSFSVFKHAPWYYYNRLAIEQSQVVVRTPFLDNDLVSLMYRVHRYDGDRRELARRLIQRGNASLATMPTDTGNTSWWKYHVLQFLFQADYCYKSGMPQWLEQLHYTFGMLSPERWLIGLHRFQHFRVWFRTQLAGYVRDIVLDPKTASRPYFNRPFLEHMVNRHLKGDRNYTDDIERVLTMELTHRTLLEA
jgi:asparagine synthase (glutamine-hydrolysing)